LAGIRRSTTRLKRFEESSKRMLKGEGFDKLICAIWDYGNGQSVQAHLQS
jgi:hypothetical protein